MRRECALLPMLPSQAQFVCMPLSGLHLFGVYMTTSSELPPLTSPQDAGEKQVASLLGIQSARAATRPRPVMRLAKQNIAMQVRGPPVAPGLGSNKPLWTLLPIPSHGKLQSSCDAFPGDASSTSHHQSCLRGDFRYWQVIGPD